MEAMGTRRPILNARGIMALAPALVGAFTWANAAGCASRAGGPRGGGGAFVCKERRAAYQVTGSMLGPTFSVRMFCDGDRPMVEEIRTDERGVEAKRGSAVSADAWETAWRQVQATGWRFLKDCNVVEMDDKAPFWVFEIGDSDRSVSITCKTLSPPFPYDSLKNALDELRTLLDAGE
jgi:hypothetical protein